MTQSAEITALNAALAIGRQKSIWQTETQARSTFARGKQYSVKDYGAVGDGVANDTAAIQAALDAAKIQGVRRGGTVFIPSGNYRVTAPLKFYVGVSISGAGWAFDSTYYNTSVIIADPAFVGSAILLQDADGQTVSDPTPRPDRSWHWGVIEKIFLKGNGLTGPHGLDPGWCGEASTIRNCSFANCNAGIYLNDVQASCTIDNVTMFDNNIGLNCDALTSATVRVFGISGDNNTNLIRVKGGVPTNVTVHSMKAEHYIAGKGDPVVDIVDLAGGTFTLIGGWADTNTARTTVIKISQPGLSTQRAKVLVMGFHSNSLYTNLINDVYDNKTVATGLGLSHPLVAYNLNLGVFGAGEIHVDYSRKINGRTSWGSVMPLIGGGSSNETFFHAGEGAVGGRLVSSNSVSTAFQWSTNGNNANWALSGKTPIAIPTLPIAAVDPATTMALVNAIRTVLIDRGISN